MGVLPRKVPFHFFDQLFEVCFFRSPTSVSGKKHRTPTSTTYKNTLQKVDRKNETENCSRVNLFFIHKICRNLWIFLIFWQKWRKSWKVHEWPFPMTECRGAGSKKLRMIFPHTLVFSKSPQLPYGAFCFFRGWGGGRFEKWSISSAVRVQELVWLITLMDLKKFSRTTSRWYVLRKCSFLVWLRSF